MTLKGERTRQHIIDVAMARFERDGFTATSMRTIASEAGVSLGLAYRYFDAKEGIVAAFYQQIAQALAAQPIAGVTLGARFQGVMRAKFSLLDHHRRAMGSLLAAMLDPDGPVGILSPATAEIREATRATLRAVIEGAANVPLAAVDPLVRVAWFGHVLLLLAWVQRPAEALTLLDGVAAALDLAAPLLGLPMAAGALSAAAAALAPFEGAAQ